MNDLPAAEAEIPVLHVVDDDPAMRDALAWLLDAPTYRVQIHDSGEAFFGAFDPQQRSCVVTDLRMPGIGGLDLQRRLRELAPEVPLLFLTGHGAVPTAVDAMKGGAVDFIEKPFEPSQLKAAVDRMIARARSGSDVPQAAERAAARVRLTPRERQVLDGVLSGRLNKQIAADLGISVKTVEVHRANLMGKFGATTVADLLRRVLSAPGRNG